MGGKEPIYLARVSMQEDLRLTQVIRYVKDGLCLWASATCVLPKYGFILLNLRLKPSPSPGKSPWIELVLPGPVAECVVDTISTDNQLGTFYAVFLSSYLSTALYFPIIGRKS